MRARRRILVALVAFIGLPLTAVTQASAYSLTGRKWLVPLSANWCASTTVTAHSSWVGFITNDIAQYNALGPYPAPNWAYSTSCSGSRIRFEQAYLASNLCGKTSTNTLGEPYIYTALIQYNNSKVYFRDGQPTGTNRCHFDWTTMHEFGHSQGLNHSCTSGTVMWHSDNRVWHFTSDDINGMRKLYDSAYTGPGPTGSCD